MKKNLSLFILLYIFLLNSTMAYQGIIIGLEAPLLQYPNIKSKVLQLVRKGEKIYIAPDPRLLKSPLEIAYNVTKRGEEIVYKYDKKLKFYHTLTKNSTDAFIPVSDVKIIYQDKRESVDPIPPSNKDPRDYRLLEPLPDNYPFSKFKHKRMQLGYLSSNPASARYPHQFVIKNESSSLQHGLKLVLSEKVSFDKFDRFYFGGIFQFHTGKRLLNITNSINSTEKLREINLGPYASFDLFRSEKFILTIEGAMTFNRHENAIAMEDTHNEISETRVYSGFSVASKIGSHFSIKNIIPKSGTDLIFGVEGSLYSPYGLKNKSFPEIPNLFSENDEIKNSISAKLALFIGLQSRY